MDVLDYHELQIWLLIEFCFPAYNGLSVLWNNDQAAMFVIILS